MSNLEEKLALYSKSLSEKCQVTPDADLLKAITKSLGPSIYNADAETVAMSAENEVETLKNNFIKKKLGITDDNEIDNAMDQVFEQIGKSNTRKYRAVLCYLLVEHFSKQSLYK